MRSPSRPMAMRPFVVAIASRIGLLGSTLADTMPKFALGNWGIASAVNPKVAVSVVSVIVRLEVGIESNVLTKAILGPVQRIMKSGLF